MEASSPAEEQPTDATTTAASPSTQGATLPHRRASVVVHGRTESGDEEDVGTIGTSGGAGLVRRDSLEKTKEYYGFRPTSSASNIKDSSSFRVQSLRREGGVERQRSDSRVSATTRGSTYTRPTSPDAGSITSPRRSTTTLPTPRAFLTPKKPQAAIRMEQLQREKARQSLDSFGSGGGDGGRPHEESPSTFTGTGLQLAGTSGTPPSQLQVLEEESTRSPAEAAFTLPSPRQGDEQSPVGSQSRSSVSSQGTVNPAGMGMGLSLRHGGGGFGVAPGGMLTTVEETGMSHMDLANRHSMTDVSTPPHIHHELSSDDLVKDRSEQTDRNRPNGVTRRNTGSGHSKVHGGAAKVRRYTMFGNPQTTFFFGGRLMTGGDSPLSLIATVTVILGLSGVWLGTTGVWLWQHGTEYGLAKGGGVAIVIIFVYLFGVVISSMLAAALRDPGIIPRNLDPDPPLSQVESWYEPDNREVSIKKRTVVVKYCETCNTYRPPRASHCRLCGNCVDGIDHHCSYIHTCVGKRNYLPFLVLLVAAIIADIYIVVFSAIHFSLLCHHDQISFTDALKDSPGAAVSFLLGVLCLAPVLFLFWYHSGLILYNLTTVEQIRASASSNLFFARKRPDNPFSADSLFGNLVLTTLGRPQFPSWVNPSGWIEHDEREVNPALREYSTTGAAHGASGGVGVTQRRP